MIVAVTLALLAALSALYLFVSCRALAAENERLESEINNLRLSLELAQRGER